MSLKRHGDQLRRSAFDGVLHNAKFKLYKAWRNGEITWEELNEELERLQRDLEVERGV